MIKIVNKFRSNITSFIGNNKKYPVITAISAGLYPLLYYYNSNFTLVNSFEQLIFFLITYLLIPIGVFCLVHVVFSRIDRLKKYNKYVLSILNFSLFVFLIILSTYGLKKKILAIGLISAFILAIIFFKHLKKVIVFQFLMILFVSAKLVPDLYKHATYSSKWMEQNDSIEDIKFKKRPNIYVIQPDGYANYSELKKSNYNFNNSEFETFLKSLDFKLYKDFRSNYISTLSSNSSMFTMKHHYYNNPSFKSNELYNSRKIIVEDNPVLSIFKKNNYKTFLMLEKSYLLVNRPKIEYDYCNISYSEVPFLARGFSVKKDVEIDLKNVIKNNVKTNNFYFIEKILPGHIAVYKNTSKGIESEREGYLESLKEANTWLKRIIQLINENDKNCIIIIAADHGGFVGLNYTLECKIKQTDQDLVKSIFTTALAIKWNGDASIYDGKLKTNINIFRVLFSYLSEDTSYLDRLEEDKSYTIIKYGAPFGVYEVINENNSVVFNKYIN